MITQQDNALRYTFIYKSTAFFNSNCGSLFISEKLIFDIPVLLFFSARDDNNIASKSKYHASTVDS